MSNYYDFDKQIIQLFVDKSVMFNRHDLTTAKKILQDNKNSLLIVG